MSNSVNPSNGNNRPSFWQNLFTGSLAGGSAVFIIQPLIYFKNASQAQVKDFEKSPRAWYRGMRPFALSFAPTIAIQTATHGIFSNFLNPLSAASLAGSFSAIVVCPAEMIMIQQQKRPLSVLQTIQHIYTSHGIVGFYRAFVPTTIRESVFTAAYLGGSPMLKERMRSFGVHEGIAQVVSGILAGTVAAVVSHPFDTIKTQQQRDFSIKNSMNQALFQKTAFAGLGWRIAMVVTATIVMPFTQEKLNKIISP